MGIKSCCSDVITVYYTFSLSKIVGTNHAQRGIPGRVVVGRPIPSQVDTYAYVSSRFLPTHTHTTCTYALDVYLYYTHVFVRPGATAENKLLSMYEL